MNTEQIILTTARKMILEGFKKDKENFRKLMEIAEVSDIRAVSLGFAACSFIGSGLDVLSAAEIYPEFFHNFLADIQREWEQ